MQSHRLDSCIGRVAQLHNLVSRPELNGAFVSVKHYDIAKDRYAVQTLTAPNEGTVIISILVKKQCLKLKAIANFDEQYPHASVQIAHCFYNEYVPGTVLDFTTDVCPFTNESADGFLRNNCSLAFNHSCRAVGAAVPLGGPWRTTFSEAVVSMLADSATLVEFSHINFRNTITCSGDGRIAFINCHFASSSSLLFPEGSQSLSILFENCVFDEWSQSLAVSNGTNITLLNCIFLTTELFIRRGGVAIVKYCTFKTERSGANGGYGVFTDGIGSRVELTHCLFSDLDAGVAIFRRASATIRHCTILRARDVGIRIEGPKLCTVSIEDCAIHECFIGINIAHGNMELTLVDTIVSHSGFYGVAVNCSGCIEINNCTITENKRRDLMIRGGYACIVKINGVQIPPDRSLFPAIDLELAELRARNTEKYGESEITLHWHRRLNLGKPVACGNCNLPEPTRNAFRMCSKCRNICYCCKACQVTHWKTGGHKQECGVAPYTAHL